MSAGTGFDCALAYFRNGRGRNECRLRVGMHARLLKKQEGEGEMLSRGRAFEYLLACSRGRGEVSAGRKGGSDCTLGRGGTCMLDCSRNSGENGRVRAEGCSATMWVEDWKDALAHRVDIAALRVYMPLLQK
jgi:hypothetical protein